MAYLVLFVSLGSPILGKWLLSHQPRFCIQETAIASKLLSLRLWYVSKEMSPGVFHSWCQSVHSWAVVSLFKVKNPTQPTDLYMSNWIFAQHFQGTGRGQSNPHCWEGGFWGDKNHTPAYGSPVMMESSGKALPGVSSTDPECRDRRWGCASLKHQPRARQPLCPSSLISRNLFIPPNFPSKVTKQLVDGVFSASV